MDSSDAAILESIKKAIAANSIILPSLPETAMRVRELSSRDDCSNAQLEMEISKDAAISARLLKVANSSALHRGGDQLSSLQQAISRLGLNLVRSLVTQLAILQVMQRGMEPKLLEKFVAHSLNISAICNLLANKHPHLDSEQASLAGLLHDIGKLPLYQYREKHQHLQKDWQRLEMQLHPAIGGILLRHWSLPDELVVAAEEHENVERDSGTRVDYADLVIAANLLHYGIEAGEYAYLAGRTIPALSKCLAGETAKELREQVADRLALSLDVREI